MQTIEVFENLVLQLAITLTIGIASLIIIVACFAIVVSKDIAK